jgi:light-harvesting complex 1 alpha chain
MADQISKPKNPDDDWKFWLVVNPATWLMPMFFALLLLVVLIHKYVLSIPGLGWN